MGGGEADCGNSTWGLLDAAEGGTVDLRRNPLRWCPYFRNTSEIHLISSAGVWGKQHDLKCHGEQGRIVSSLGSVGGSKHHDNRKEKQRAM